MADRKHVLHIKSNVAETTTQYGIDDFLVTPKKPVDSATGKATDDTLLYGEIAVNYGKGVEALTIRNTEDNVVAFVNENDFHEANEIAADGLATEKLEREEADNSLNNKIDTLVSEIVSTTYVEIKVLREQSKLKAGQSYRITDYVTTTTQENTQSAGHVFDVIVIATDVDTLNENAKVIKHEGDTYFADCNLDAWEIKYDLDNDTTKYAWADDTNGKGVIFYMKDEWNNECPYDFKNIQFKRWAVTDVQNEKLDEETLNDLKEYFVYDNDNTKFITRYAYQNSNCTHGSTTHVVDGNDSDWYYTFSTVKLENGIYALDEIEDASIKRNNFYRGCFGNTIKPYYNDPQYLNNIVFNGYYSTNYYWNQYHCFANSFGYDSHDDTFGHSCNYNSFGDNCYGNIFGNEFDENRFGIGCSDNSFGRYCNGNTFGNYFNGNTFGQSCGHNSFGSDCNNNSFGQSCSYNLFGQNAYDISFGQNCTYNSFGQNAYDISFGQNCTYNSFGNSCGNNTFGNDCYDNSFGNECESNTFGDNCYENSFGNSCNSNIFGNVCQYNSFGNECYSNSFGNAFYSNSFGNECFSNSFGNAFYSNTFGDNCRYNSFGNECGNNTFGNGCFSNSFGNRVQNVKFEKDFMQYNIVENGNTYITVTSTQTTSSSRTLRNFTIAQGVNNATSEDQRKTISHNTTNDTFKTTYQNASSQTVNV